MVPVAAKVGALLAVAAAGSTSVWYFSDSIFGSPLVSVTEGPEGTSYETNSIGKKYGDYFLSSKVNKSTWKKRFEDNKSKFSAPGEDSASAKAKDKFGTVTEAYSVDPTKTTALNRVCEAAYKETTSTNLSDSDEANKYTKEHIWKFCGLGAITVVGDDSDYNDKIGGAESEKKLFVSTKGERNNWFWDLKTKEFWASKSSVQGTSATDNVFKKLADSTEDENKKTNIKDTCEEAYKKGTSDNNKNKDDALTFCSIKLKIGS